MATVLRGDGLRIVIYVNDHLPAHVFGDGEAKINLIGAHGAPELVWASAMTHGEIRRSMRLVVDRSAFLRSGWRKSMGELTDAEIDVALERGRAARSSEPRAAAARYDRRSGRVIVELTNGCTFAFPPRLAQGLEAATAEQLAKVEILGAGSGLHWEELDADLAIPGLLAGLFGTKAYLARQAGRVTSPAKAAAARSNGSKGGRPRRTA